MYYKSHLYITFYLSFSYLFSQITGNVVDSKTGEPLPSVNVVSGEKGISTDANGIFSIEVTTKEPLIFSHVGYETISKEAKNGMVIRLVPKLIDVNEIVVYSGLNEESIHKSGHNASVIGQSELKRLSYDHFQTLTSQVPNLNWAGGTSRPRYFQIRGIGERSQYFGEGAPNFSVGFILDDMELSGLGMLGNLFDLNQIEVFRGPMSSVFGTNSLAGLISLRSNNPGDTLRIKSLLSGGTDNYLSLGTMLNLPVNNKLQFRFSGSILQSDGFRYNKFKESSDSNKKDEQFIRVKLNYKPLKNFKVLSTLIYAELDNGYDSWAPDNNTDFHTYSDDTGEDSQKTLGGSVRINLNSNNKYKFTSISAYTKTNLTHSYDGDWANDQYWYSNHGFDSQVEGWSYEFFDKNDKERKSTSQDFRLSFHDLILGVFYKNLIESDEANGYLFGGLSNSAKSQYDFGVYSGYFKYDWKINPKIKLTTNYRLEKNTIDYSGQSEGMDYYYNTINLPNVKHSNSFFMNGYRASIIIKKTQSLNYFGSIAKGYKSGGVNQQPYINNKNRNYGPEELRTLELGIKYFSDKIYTNINLFHGLRANQQISISSQQIEGDPNSFIFFTSNAGSGTIGGIELESKIKFNQNTAINISGSLLDSWVDKFTYTIENDELANGGSREAAMAPKISGSMNLQHRNTWGYESILKISYKSNYYYSDSHNNQSKAYTVTDLSVAKEVGKNFIFTLWGTNILDERYSTRGFYFGLVPPDYPDQLFESYADPRQIGISIANKF